MTGARPNLRFLLDEGVPDSVGRCLAAAGHEALFHRNVLPPGTPDPLVCAASLSQDAILVALDADMRAIARGHGVGQERFKRLSLLKLSCSEPDAARRVREGISLLEHEWLFNTRTDGRRLFVEIGSSFIKTNR